MTQVEMGHSPPPSPSPYDWLQWTCGDHRASTLRLARLLRRFGRVVQEDLISHGILEGRSMLYLNTFATVICSSFPESYRYGSQVSYNRAYQH